MIRNQNKLKKYFFPILTLTLPLRYIRIFLDLFNLEGIKMTESDNEIDLKVNFKSAATL